MSVFELAGLQKLRRIGLVRVNNLTDQAIYSLAERHSTLERIHLSYCDQITVMAIHFLLQKLLKLTHLSLTGVPAFRRPELQQFCRDPPPVRATQRNGPPNLIDHLLQDFNNSQRQAFCVYSGKGVSELREFLAELFNTITDEIAAQSGTEYDDEDEEVYGHPMAVVEDEDEDEEDEEEYVHHGVARHGTVTFADHQTMRSVVPHPPHIPMDVQYTPPHVARDMLMTRERAHMPVTRHSAPSVYPGNIPFMQPAAPTPSAGPSRRGRGFGHHPIIEASTSPAPSDAASNRSGGTNHSTGTGFFRNYTEAAQQSNRAGVITPDLVFAEIGHGRGAVQGYQLNGRWNGESMVVVPPPHSVTYSSMPVGTSAHPMYTDHHQHLNGFNPEPSNPFPQPQSPPMSEVASSWTLVPSEVDAHSLTSSPTREPQDSQTALMADYADGREVDARGRNVKRSLRNTFTAAEQYASSFLFGRGPNGTSQDGMSGPSTRPRGDNQRF